MFFFKKTALQQRGSFGVIGFELSVVLP